MTCRHGMDSPCLTSILAFQEQRRKTAHSIGFSNKGYYHIPPDWSVCESPHDSAREGTLVLDQLATHEFIFQVGIINGGRDESGETEGSLHDHHGE
jgi:hypothetical protein